MFNNIDIKEKCLRIAKQINHNLQKSKMNPVLKPYFTESSIQYFNKNGITGVALNLKSIDYKSTIDNIGDVRFKNNIKLLEDTVKKAIKKENLEDYVSLQEFTPVKESFEYNGLLHDKYINLVLVFNENAGSRIMFDVEKRNSFNNPNTFNRLTDYSQNTYNSDDVYPQGPMTRLDLVKDIEGKNNSKNYHGRFEGNVYKNSILPNQYASIHDMNDVANLDASDDSIIRRDVGKNLYTSNQLDVDTKDSKLSEDTHFFTVLSRVDPINESTLLSVQKLLKDCGKEFYNAIYRAGINSENEITENQFNSALDKDIEAIHKGKKVSFDYFLYYAFNSFDEVTIRQAYIIASNLVKQFNIKTHDLKLDINFRVYFKEIENETKHTITKNNMKVSLNKNFVNMLMKNESGSYKNTKVAKRKYKSFSLFVFIESPIYKLTSY